MVDFSIAKGDTLPLLTATLNDNAGPIDLTGSTSIKFQMRPPGSSALEVDGAASVVGAPTLGNVSYVWQSTDVDTPGLYLGWFLLMFGGSKTMEAPNPPLVIEVTRGPG
jgi:hypothetical protein